MLITRPFQPCDRAAIRDAEIKCYENPWIEAEFSRFGRRTVVGVADGHLVAYFCTDSTKVLRMGVLPNWRRMTVGTQMMEIAKIESLGRLTIVVPEDDEGSQFFLRSVGFKCVNIIKDTGYFFLWRRVWYA